MVIHEKRSKEAHEKCLIKAHRSSHPAKEINQKKKEILSDAGAIQGRPPIALLRKLAARCVEKSQPL